jgi:GDP-D-mannose 3',5'-epimerase
VCSDSPELILVAGAGGFIGGHLVRRLEAAGHEVRAVDIKPFAEWFHLSPTAENLEVDLSQRAAADAASADVSTVYNLASDMGGMGFIEANKALCMLSVLINTHLLLAARDQGVRRYFFASSACVYPDRLQAETGVQGLREGDAYPAMPEDGYGWEKLFGERMCRHFSEDFGLSTRVARYHNIYGPFGTWQGGREKAPAAICRKVAEAIIGGSGEIEIWGDGSQTRSFTSVDDCIDGTLRLVASDVTEPLNIGSDEMVTIDQLASTVEDIAGVALRRKYVIGAPTGVRGRNSDNTLIKARLGWSPTTALRAGLEKTFDWVFDQVMRQSDVLGRGRGHERRTDVRNRAAIPN